LSTLATGVMLLGGLALLGISIHSFVLHGTSVETISMMAGGSVASGLGFWAVKEMRKGKSYAWKPLGKFQQCTASERGCPDTHPVNQDRSFYVAMDSGVLFGVFDGHGQGGEQVSTLCQEKFGDYFKENYGKYTNVQDAFNSAVRRLQEDTREMFGGSVMAACYIDYSTMQRTTALLGDCEVRCLRRTAQGVLSIPLTKPTDWGDLTERTRAIKAGYEILDFDTPTDKPRVFKGESSCNFTGSIGDRHLPFESVLHRTPTFQIDTAQEGDLMVAMTHGISDFGYHLPYDVKRNWGTPENLARIAVAGALKARSQDDRTAVCVFIPPTSPQSK
jgi:serine/threonine protein phosphatase PrpC